MLVRGDVLVRGLAASKHLWGDLREKKKKSHFFLNWFLENTKQIFLTLNKFDKTLVNHHQ